MFTKSGTGPSGGFSGGSEHSESPKGEDYVYLALVNGRHDISSAAAAAAAARDRSLCGRLSPRHCLDRVGAPALGACGAAMHDGRMAPKRFRRLLLTSGGINVLLVVLLVSLVSAWAYQLSADVSSRHAASKQMEATVTNASCLVPQLCTDALWEQFQDHFYWFSWQHVTWAQARERCRRLGTDLVSIRNRKENDFLVKKMLTKFRPGNRASGHYFWIGLMRDITTLGQNLAWVDGSAMTFEQWSTGQPDNEGGLEHCGQSSLSPGNRGRWADRRCWTQQPFVCKRHIQQ